MNQQEFFSFKINLTRTCFQFIFQISGLGSQRVSATLQKIGQVLERKGLELIPRGAPVSEMEALAVPWSIHGSFYFFVF